MSQSRDEAIQNEIENNDPSVAERDCPICGALKGTPHKPMQNATDLQWGIYCDGKVHRNSTGSIPRAESRRQRGYGKVTVQLLDGRKFEFPDTVLMHEDKHITIHNGNRTIHSFHNELVSEAFSDNHSYDDNQ